MKLEAYTAVNFNDLKTLTVLKFLGYNFDNFTIHLAAIKGHFEMVKWPEKNTRVFPLASTSYTCIKNGHREIAVFLVKHYPKDCVKHVNIQYATKYGCLDMFKDIYDISDLTEKTKQDVIYAFLTPNN